MVLDCPAGQGRMGARRGALRRKPRAQRGWLRFTLETLVGLSVGV